MLSFHAVRPLFDALREFCSVVIVFPVYLHIFSNSSVYTCEKVNITKTCLYNFDPLKPHFYIVKLELIFLISAQKHRLWVLVKTASVRTVTHNLCFGQKYENIIFLSFYFFYFIYLFYYYFFV